MIMGDRNDHPAVDDEQQQEAFEKMLDEIVEKYRDTLRRLGDS